MKQAVGAGAGGEPEDWATWFRHPGAVSDEEDSAPRGSVLSEGPEHGVGPGTCRQLPPTWDWVLLTQ